MLLVLQPVIGGYLFDKPRGILYRLARSGNTWARRIHGAQWQPAFHIAPAIAFIVNCQTQAELDELWEKSPKGKKATMWMAER